MLAYHDRQAHLVVDLDGTRPPPPPSATPPAVRTPLLGPLASLGSLLACLHQNEGAASPDPDRMAALAGRRPAVNAKYPKTTIRICPV